MSSRISPETYPIAATATAPAYDFETAAIEVETSALPAPAVAGQQQALFSSLPSNSRIIPFDSLTTEAERQSIRSRAANLPRPAPLRNERVELPHARPRRSSSVDQGNLDFFVQENPLPASQTYICDAPVAPAALRFHAALLDSAIIFLGCAVVAAIYLAIGGSFPADKHLAVFLAAPFLATGFFYKFLWAFAGRDTFGTTKAGLHLVDFDGNPPPRKYRFHRLFGSLISLSAAGVGLIWVFVDEDGLAWHDHMSNTFPTFLPD